MLRFVQDEDSENDFGIANGASALGAMMHGVAYEHGINKSSLAFVGLMKYSVRATLDI